MGTVPHLRVIHLHPAAPPKPPEGAACNGCGLCCSAEPCPLGQWLSGRRAGACVALRWHDAEQRHLCGVLDDPQAWLRWLPASWGRALTRRWIAAGRGCDCDYEVESPAAASAAAPGPR